MIFLIDIGSTHNFIHRRVPKETHYFVHAIHNFKIMIANGGMMKCGGRCENVKLEIGEYHLKYHMFSIEMGGCDIFLDAKWLCTLGPVSMDFKDLYTSFTEEGKKHTLEEIKYDSPKIISYHHMEKLFKK
jgi:hypothetical protein